MHFTAHELRSLYILHGAMIRILLQKKCCQGPGALLFPF